MTPTVLTAISTMSCLVVVPEVLHASARFDQHPRAGLAVWTSLNVVGWLSAIALFLRVGLGAFQGSLVSRTVLFIEQLGDGHPLRGLGLTEVVGLSVAADISFLLTGSLVLTAWKIHRLRREQRTIIDLVAESRPGRDAACLLRHDQPLAYYLPGRGGRVVMSTGALDVLSASEYRSVVRHELGHGHGHHGAVMIPIHALAPFVQFLPLARYAPNVMRSYLEMAADDYARTGTSTEALRGALIKSTLFELAPVGALGMSHHLLERRLRRLGAPPRRVVDAAAATAVMSAAISATALLAIH